MAEWIVAGEPSMDVSHMDINRFGRQYRSPVATRWRARVENYRTYYDIPYPGPAARVGPAAAPLAASTTGIAAHGAVFGEKAGWERVDYYAANAARAGDARPAAGGWAGRDWSPADRRSNTWRTRERGGAFDESSFAKIEVSGPDAADFLEWVCDNQVARGVGDVTYTQASTPRGGIEADFTVTRLARGRLHDRHRHRVGTRDLAWLRRQARAERRRRRHRRRHRRARAASRCGDRARASCSQPDAGRSVHAAFPFMTAQDLTVGDVPVRALRVTFVGELGWELYAPAEYGAAPVGACSRPASGRPAAGGYRAIESLRLEKGYRVWGADVTAETNALRGRPRLLRQARQTRWVRRRGGAGQGQGGAGSRDGCVPGARRPGERRPRRGTRARRRAPGDARPDG